jgi:hypothetical protein
MVTIRDRPVVTQRYPPVERATRAELRRMHCSAVTDTMGALAVSLAQRMDSEGLDSKSAAAVAAQLRLVMDDVAKSGRSKPARDAIDELNARRAVKRAG